MPTFLMKLLQDYYVPTTPPRRPLATDDVPKSDAVNLRAIARRVFAAPMRQTTLQRELHDRRRSHHGRLFCTISSHTGVMATENSTKMYLAPS